MSSVTALSERSDASPNKQFEEISNVPLRQKIVQVLREAILSGELKPGDALIETALATQLGVSRAPLREAMRSLSKDGLIETVPYRGTTVKTLSSKDIEEIYSLRGLHESFAVQRILERNRVSDVDTLNQICKNMKKAAKVKDLKMLNQEDDSFHRQLILLAEHDMLTAIWDQLALRVRQLMSLRNQLNRNPMEIAMNHPPIVQAIADKNLARATALIQKHVASAKDLIMDDFTNQNQG
jgi:DNA-binding GntR family transcriptional regulator